MIMRLRILLAFLILLAVFASGFSYWKFNKKNQSQPTDSYQELTIKRINQFDIDGFLAPTEEAIKNTDKVFMLLTEREKASEIVYHSNLWDSNDLFVGGIYEWRTSQREVVPDWDKPIPPELIEAFPPFIFWTDSSLEKNKLKEASILLKNSDTFSPDNKLKINPVTIGENDYNSTHLRILIITPKELKSFPERKEGKLCIYPCYEKESLYAPITFEFLSKENAENDLTQLEKYDLVWLENFNPIEYYFESNKQIFVLTDSLSDLLQEQIKTTIRLKLDLGLKKNLLRYKQALNNSKVSD